MRLPDFFREKVIIENKIIQDLAKSSNHFHNNELINAIPDEEIGRLFDIVRYRNSDGLDIVSVEFLNGIGKILYDGGHSIYSVLKDPIISQAAITLLDGGKVDFEDGIFEDKSINPCVSDIISKLKEKDTNASINPDVPEDGITTFTSYILDIFNTDPTYNIIFKVEQLGRNPQGFELNGRTSNESNGFLIKLDRDLVSDATRLFIAKTIIHESTHAFLLHNNYNVRGSELTNMLNEIFIRYRNNPDNDLNLVQHEFIGQFVEALAHSLYVWDNKQLPFDYYRSLSWGGLETSSAYKRLPSEKRDEIQRIIQNERFNRKNARSERCN